MSIFCRHFWELIDSTTTESPIEVARKLGFTSIEITAPTERKHIQTFRCKKCGKIKRYVETLT